VGRYLAQAVHWESFQLGDCGGFMGEADGGEMASDADGGVVGV
jgi:hypothetical protein